MNQQPANQSLSSRCLIASVGAYVFISLLYTFPLILNLNSKTPVLGLNYSLMGNAELMVERLAVGESPLNHPRVFFPAGYTIHEGFLPSFLAVILGGGSNPLLGLNLSILLSYILSAVGAFFLALEVTRSKSGAFLAGVFYSFSAFHYFNLAIYPIRHIEWLPWFLFAALAYQRSRRGKYLGLLGLSFIAGCLSSWYFAVFFLIICLALLVSFFRLRREFLPVLQIGLVLGVSCLILIPFLPNVLLGSSGTATGSLALTIDGSADLLSFLIPPSNHWLLSEWVDSVQYSWLGNASLRSNYLGTLSLLIAVLGIYAGSFDSSRIRFFLILLASITLVLALGPFLIVNGADGWSPEQYPANPSDIKLPYHWLSGLFPFSATRATARYVIITLLVVSIGLAAGVKFLESRLPGQRVSVPLVLGFLILCIELAPLWPIQLKSPMPSPPIYSELGEEPGNFSILELPFDIRAYRYVYNAKEHRKKVLGGSIDKPFRRFRQTVTRYPFFRTLFDPTLVSRASQKQQVVSGEGPDDFAEDTLNLLRVKYAIVHKWDPEILSFGDYFQPDPRVDQLSEIIAPYFRLHGESDSVLVFRRDIGSDFLVPTLGSGWGPLEDHGSYTDRPLIGTEASIEVVSSRERKVCLEIYLSVILTPKRTLVVSFNGEELLRQTIPERKAAGETHLVRLPRIRISVGRNSLRIGTPEPARSIQEVFGGQDTRPISFLLNDFSVTPLE